MADAEITWRGVTLGSDDSDIDIEQITGWDDLPEITSHDEPRTRGHGDHIGDQFSRARIVTVTGSIASRAARDELAAVIIGMSPVESAVETLTVETFGRQLTAGARLIRRSLPVGENYASGYIPFALQWRCPDPLRYGLPQAPASTGLPTSGGGLSYPLTYGLDYGAVGDTGQIVLTNPGTAPAPIFGQVTGGLPFGFELSSATGRLVYPVEVPAGQVIDIDTARGTVLVEGTASRRGNLTVADWPYVPAGSSLTIQLASLGGVYDPAARFTVPTPRAAYW